ncbi:MULTISPECIES: adenosylcobalamin-dependent ribonucleoside-diphosphate reductase [Methanothrix]|uniref:Vitamin B12-dependent ribonucleotide reductase n=1 Tax=Methanothrix thermoacetophila (strain DSM 6194 / JCM 14653 / NBRC 101360 / PT) TaxID=349307 RepID=A0B8R8_METTP|nr:MULTISPECIES: adenosylcobalamin-dependent ribonucleoside-diphosphate reductase [Methanothrix]ABK15092.1 ribonucleoside-diphosphate reductase, adenosylcobalamin-dependent [Methanothrix thermoacetophila PT]
MVYIVCTGGIELVERIRKRDGRIVDFDPSRISRAISKAFNALGIVDEKTPVELAGRVVDVVDERFRDEIPSVEDVQDIVEEVLIDAGYAQVAKAYILYRQRRSEIREAKHYLGVADDLKLSVNAIEVLKKRYLKRDEFGNVVETPGEMFERVASAVSAVERRYEGDADDARKKFLSMMRSLSFLPNSPTLMNAGLPLGQLSACFVVPVEDSIAGIFDALKYMALIHQSGGGTGFSFSRLRPKGDVVRSTGGIASGPVSFMRIFDAATDVIKQGGRRRGANMGILRVDHPDITEFIACKDRGGMDNFNISVAITEEFMRQCERDGSVELINPRTGEATGEMSARDLMVMMATYAWRRGDPGVVFIDRINALHPVPGIIEATNPCGEQPLLPFESCNLGSVNLSRMVERGEISWDRLEETVRLAVRFLDDVIDANRFPLKQIEDATLRTRKIGLGVMGFAEMLIQLGVSYASQDALRIAEELMAFITKTAREESCALGRERGSFPLFEESSLKKWDAMRNATVTTIAPTGTISIIAGTSSGIEPLFAVSFVRHVLEGARLIESSPLFERMASERGIMTPALRAEVARRGSIQEIPGIPDDIKELFLTALDISPEQHVRIQAAFQKHTDNAVSKTVNLPEKASVSDVIKVYRLAYELGCKGITVYRYGSREQVLYLGEPDALANGCRFCGG